MKIKLQSVLFLAVLLSSIILNAQNYTLEAEDGILTGVEIANATQGYSGTGYVTGWDNNGTDQVTVTFDAPEEGAYQIKIGFATPYGAKVQQLLVNGSLIGNVSFPQTDTFSQILGTNILLPEGDNTITIRTSWGWFLLDNFVISPQEPHDYTTVATSLIDNQANQATVNLYNFLKSTYGNYIISGQTIDSQEGIMNLTGKSFVVKAVDFGSYSPKFAWGWANGGPAFTPAEYGQTDSIIAWYNNTQGCGITTVQWHWHSPSGGTIRTNTFMTSNTTFNMGQAIISGTTEYSEVIRDIDSIASKLKILENAGVPVLWRPLHEAGGGWFWWSDEGADGVKALWDIMYDRLTNYHNLHNLIWVWSTPEEEYYLGNDKLDIFGMDSYPGDYNYTIQKSYFDQMYDICNGKKILAMTENGPIPDVDNCFAGDAKWAYFMTWDNFYETQNTLSHLRYTYSSQKTLTLDEACQVAFVENIEPHSFNIYPNPASSVINIEIDSKNILQNQITIYNTNGQKVFEKRYNKNKIIIDPNLIKGLYLLKITNNKSSKTKKLIIE